MQINSKVSKSLKVQCAVLGQRKFFKLTGANIHDESYTMGADFVLEIPPPKTLSFND